MTPQTLARPRPSRRSKLTPVEAGLPDPRPVTDYTVEYEEIDGKSRVTVTLEQPCIIRSPAWRFIDVNDGSSIAAASVTAKDNVTIVFDFEGIIYITVAFIDVPYQDPQVQNFQGGFVRPGGRWFRKPE